MDLTDRVGIVTGGGTGIGRAVCEALARAGAHGVTVNYSRSADGAKETVENIHQLGADAIAVRANVASQDDCAALVEATVRRFGRVDILVNNAGITHLIPFDDLDAITDEVWDEIFAVNLKGAFYCARAAAEHLRKHRGAIVNISSTAAHRASGSSLPYSVSKAAVLHLTRGLALALAPDVRVNAVSPGTVASRWHTELVGDEAAGAKFQADAEQAPLRQVAAPDDVADAVIAFLKTDQVTGESLILDGGRHLLY